jgi:ABC transporter substrate binding protein (PQQ-dependent alcohol dehydrogenase system)
MRRRLAPFIAMLAGGLFSGMAWAAPAPGEKPVSAIAIVYLSREDPDTARASLSDPVIADYGWQGAKFGVEEINKNGRFLGKQYELIRVAVSADGDLAGAARGALTAGHLLVIADLKRADLLAVADLAEAKDAVIFDARTSDDSLRQSDCRRNVFHLLPNWAMRADALAQFLVRKNWKSWLLLSGEAPEDQAYAASWKRSAAKVGAAIVAEKSYRYRTDSADEADAHAQIQSQLAALTRADAGYDIALVVDTQDAFGAYVPYNTWSPRPVAGTHGLTAVAWNPLFREYAARGMQYRFFLAASRDMTERDYGNWLAAAIIGEAVTRGGKADAAAVRSFVLSDQFAVAAFKGEGLSFRLWDHQLRQPLLLFGPRLLVSMWPQETSDRAKFQTDTIGYDQPQSTCRFSQ